MMQHIDKPTRFRAQDEPHVLDLVITDGDFIDALEYCSSLGKSDHALLSFACNFLPELRSTEPTLNLNKGNYNALRQFLVKEWGEELPDDTTVDQMWSKLRTILDEGIRTHIPLTKPWKKNHKWHHPVDSEYKKMIRKKHRLWTRLRETQTVEAERAYKKQRNLVRKESWRLERK